MKKFIFCDWHIGHKDHKEANYNVMTEAINYVRGNHEEGDEIWGLGDWFHMVDGEVGVEKCRDHAVTKALIRLAGEIPIKLVWGNHDYELGSHSGLFSPIEIVQPLQENEIPFLKGNPFLEDNGIWYGHGQQFCPICKMFSKRVRKCWAKLIGKKTPGYLKGEAPTKTYLTAVHWVHSTAILDVIEAREKGKHYRGIVLGHTHLPLQYQCPELPFLINGGDMMDSLTFLVQDDNVFHLMKWNKTEKKWQEMSNLIV